MYSQLRLTRYGKVAAAVLLHAQGYAARIGGRTIPISAVLLLAEFLRVDALQLLRLPTVRVWSGIIGDPFIRVDLVRMLRRHWLD